MKTLTKSVQLNYTLSNGMLITTARLIKGNPRVKVFITDLHSTARGVIDIQRKELLYVNAAIDFSKADVDGVITAIELALKVNAEIAAIELALKVNAETK
jgi:hypothetical protein